MSERREQASKRERGRKKNPLVPSVCTRCGSAYFNKWAHEEECPGDVKPWTPANNAQRAAWKASGGK